MVVEEVVAMPLGRIQAAAWRSDDLQHSQHFLGRSLDHQRSLTSAWIEGRFAAHDRIQIKRFHLHTPYGAFDMQALTSHRWAV